jgi:NAD(P)-dependent dehydrogenase (short-subunit alcohol dehydrogenase family)
MLNLENKVIVITGASSGIGRQCAITLSKLGAKIILFGRNNDKIDETKSMLYTNDYLFYSQDIMDIQQFESSIESAVKKFGVIDGFIHSAGVQTTFPLRKHNKDVFLNQFNINALSAFEITRILTKRSFFNQQGGSIIFISSIRGILGDANILGYSASKGALIAGAKSLSIELADRKIRVNTVSPGMVEDTSMTTNAVKLFSEEWTKKSKQEYPLGWVGVSDVANACLFLLSDLSTKITGINLLVDGGFSAK